MKLLKKNQIIIYVIALMLVTAGYLNYTTTNWDSGIQVNADAEELSQMANIGDAQLVSSNAITEGNITEGNMTKENTTNEVTKNTMEEGNTTRENQTSNQTTTDMDSTNTVKTNAGNESEYFTKSKLERDKMYSQMIETYEKVLNSSNSLETQKQAATEEITKLNNIKNSIMICENLMTTKGFDHNVIFVNGESISVIVGKKEIKQEEIAQIQNIISREMKAKIENIHIATK